MKNARRVLSESDVTKGQMSVDWNMRDLMPNTDLLGSSIRIIMRIGGEKYEALYKLPVLSPTLDQLGQSMQKRNAFNQSGATASLVGVGGTTPTITITMPSSAAVPSAVIPVSGLNSSGAESYGGKNISHVPVSAGQTITLPLK